MKATTKCLNAYVIQQHSNTNLNPWIVLLGWLTRRLRNVEIKRIWNAELSLEKEILEDFALKRNKLKGKKPRQREKYSNFKFSPPSLQKCKTIISVRRSLTGSLRSLQDVNLVYITISEDVSFTFFSSLFPQRSAQQVSPCILRTENATKLNFSLTFYNLCVSRLLHSIQN